MSSIDFPAFPSKFGGFILAQVMGVVNISKPFAHNREKREKFVRFSCGREEKKQRAANNYLILFSVLL